MSGRIRHWSGLSKAQLPPTCSTQKNPRYFKEILQCEFITLATSPVILVRVAIIEDKQQPEIHNVQKLILGD